MQVLEPRHLLSAAGLELDPTSPTALLVRFRDGIDPSSQIVAGTHLDASLPLVNGLFRITVDAATPVSDALAAYSQNNSVLYAQPDVEVQIGQVPNDSSFSQLWGLNNTGQSGGTADADIDAVEAWDRTTGSSSIVVGVVDTGIDYNHPDLAANIWINPGEVAGNGVDDDQNGFVDDLRGYDFANNDADPIDDNNHGTHVAGTIGAVSNNGQGIAGVAWNVKLMALKFLTASGSGSTSNAIRAIDYARVKGVKILNNSWGGGGYNQALYDAIERARQAGIIFVAAAGNSASNNDATPYYPANYSPNNVVAVAATDRYDNLASFSSYGATQVDLAAPGVSILSTVRNGQYATFNGTSMATPHVAGALALVWSYFPTYTYRQVIDQVLNNVDPIASLSGKVATGGRLNVFRALTGGVSDTTGPRITAAIWSGSDATSLNRLRVTFSETLNASSFTAADVALTNPTGGAIAVNGITLVTGSNGLQYDITFANLTAGGTYRAVIGPQIADLAGNLMNQDGDAIFGEATQDQFVTTFLLQVASTRTYTWAGTAAIRDRTTTSTSLVISENVAIDDLNVQVNISHTWDSDLIITLIDPRGTRVQLFNRRGGSGDNVLATFDDEATTAISGGAAPFNGSFRPEKLLSGYDGRLTAGTWVLEIQDKARGDTGTLNSFSLIVQTRTAITGAPSSSHAGATTITRDGLDLHSVASQQTASVTAATLPAARPLTINSLDTSPQAGRVAETAAMANHSPERSAIARYVRLAQTLADRDFGLRLEPSLIDAAFADANSSGDWWN